MDLVLVIAYTRNARRNAVASALAGLGIRGWTEVSVTGHGQAASGHGVEHVRFEVVLDADQQDECVRAISEAAHTGAPGDGLVLAVPVLTIERISDFSKGRTAIHG